VLQCLNKGWTIIQGTNSLGSEVAIVSVPDFDNFREHRIPCTSCTVQLRESFPPDSSHKVALIGRGLGALPNQTFPENPQKDLRASLQSISMNKNPKFETFE
jgi:hypothetical protein